MQGADFLYEAIPTGASSPRSFRMDGRAWATKSGLKSEAYGNCNRSIYFARSR